MRPDTSRWRNRDSYDIFDTLPVEGLAWECLRRHEPYQGFYQALATAKSESLPLPQEAQKRWGLRFPGTPRLVCPQAKHFLDAHRRSGGFDPDAATRHSKVRIVSSPRRTRRRAR